MKFYVYVYCNPLKKGNYTYQENGVGIDFDYAPFYIGKGSGRRFKNHLKEAEKLLQIEQESINEDKKINWHKINTINKIINCGKEVIIYKICENMNEKSSFQLEKFLIKLIGRVDKKTGILTNMTDGGEGVTNISQRSLKQRVSNKIIFNKNNPEVQRKAVIKGVETRKSILDNYKNAAIKRLLTINNNEGFSKIGLKSSHTQILNKSQVGTNNKKYKRINHAFLIYLFFTCDSLNEILSIYNSNYSTIGISKFNYFLTILNFPKEFRKNKKIRLDFIKENKDKVQWYIDNYERLEQEYFDKLWYEKNKHKL